MLSKVETLCNTRLLKPWCDKSPDRGRMDALPGLSFQPAYHCCWTLASSILVRSLPAVVFESFTEGTGILSVLQFFHSRVAAQLTRAWSILLELSHIAWPFCECGKICFPPVIFRASLCSTGHKIKTLFFKFPPFGTLLCLLRIPLILETSQLLSRPLFRCCLPLFSLQSSSIYVLSYMFLLLSSFFLFFKQEHSLSSPGCF